jgi:hypothetical protein
MSEKPQIHDAPFASDAPSKKMKTKVDHTQLIEADQQVYEKSVVARSFGDNQDKLLDLLNSYASENDDPPAVFIWRELEPFIASIIALGDGAPPCPFELPVPLNPDNLKRSILQYLTPEGVIEQFGGVLPCTLAQLTVAVSKAIILCAMPWTVAVTENMAAENLPIAHVLVPVLRSNKMAQALSPVPQGLARLWC